MNACRSWGAAVEAAPELIPVVELQVPSLELEKGTTEALIAHATAVQRFLSSAAAPRARHCVNVRLTGVFGPRCPPGGCSSCSVAVFQQAAQGIP